MLRTVATSLRAWRLTGVLHSHALAALKARREAAGPRELAPPWAQLELRAVVVPTRALPQLGVAAMGLNACEAKPRLPVAEARRRAPLLLTIS